MDLKKEALSDIYFCLSGNYSLTTYRSPRGVVALVRSLDRNYSCELTFATSGGAVDAFGAELFAQHECSVAPYLVHGRAPSRACNEYIRRKLYRMYRTYERAMLKAA